MLSSFKIRNQLLILFISGVLTGFSIYSIYLTPLLILGYCYFLKKLEINRTKKNAFYDGVIFGTGYFFGCLHWIVFPFLIYEKHFILAPFILIIFPILMSIFFAVSAMLIYFTRRINPDFRFLKISVVSVILFSSEWLRSFLFGGLPLSLTAHIWSFQYQLISIASYIGVFGLSYLTIYWLVLVSSFYTKKVVCFFIIIFFPLFLYFVPTSNYDYQSNQEKYPVRIIQPNIPQEEKWNRAFYQKNFEKLIHLTKKQISNEKIIVVWPEVALTLFLNEEKELLKYLRMVLPQNIILVTGSLRREFHDSGYKVYNSFFILSDDKVQYYDKIKLVPFGEFIPFKNILDFLKVTPGSTDFSSGLKENNIKLRFNNESIFIEPSICFESIFQTFSFNKINFFINITNDAWFGQTTGPSQHLAATIFRSVEKGVPLVRSANSGISVIINKNGKILKSKRLNSTGYLQSNISLGNNKTFFMKVGNTSVILLIFIIIFFSIIMDLIFKYRKKD